MAQPEKPASRSVTVVSLVLIGAAAFNRPFEFWSQNAWEIFFPIKVLLIASGGFALGVGLWFLIRRLGAQPIAAAIAVGTGLLVFYYWNVLPGSPWLWLALGIGAAVLLPRVLDTRLMTWIALAAIAIVGVLPLLEVGLAHWQKRQAFPLAELPIAPSDVSATGNAEDLVLVIPDTYPSPVIAESWFGHDMSGLEQDLADSGMTFERAGVSRATFTGVSVPSMLELQVVLDAGLTGPWGHRNSLYDLIRGDSYTHHALRSAGFSLNQIDSGWAGAGCTGAVDLCVESPFLDETVSALLSSSLAGSILDDTIASYTVAASKSAVENTIDLMSDLQGNGRHDFLISHIILPHTPIYVDGNCDVVIGEPPIIDEFSGQLECVDGWLAEIAAAAGPDTVMVITADHGSPTTGQVYEPPAQWTDASIAERFSVFLSYRMPEVCEQPEDATNVDVFRAAVACVVDVDMPPRTEGYLIGEVDPDWVEPARMDRIRTMVEAGTPPPPPWA